MADENSILFADECGQQFVLENLEAHQRDTFLKDNNLLLQYVRQLQTTTNQVATYQETEKDAEKETEKESEKLRNVSDNEHTKKKNVSKKRKIMEIIGENNKIGFETEFLSLIFERPPIFNYTIPISERSTGITNKMFEEVADNLEVNYEKLEIEDLKAYWRPLRDGYTRYKSPLNSTASGSSSSVHKAPNNLELLRNLDGVMERRRQICSLTTPDIDINADESICVVPESPKNKESRKKNKKQILEENMLPLHLAAKAFQKVLDAPTTTPEPPQNAETLFGTQVGLHLKELSAEDSIDAQYDIMGI